jgi:hypothetical protein
MAIKFTMLIQDATAISSPNAPVHRIGGFSESWYFPGTNIQAALTAAFQGAPNVAGPGLCIARAGLLPVGSGIIGQRVQVVDPPGLSQSLSMNFPGSSGNPTNAPQVSLLCKVPGLGVRNIRRVVLRALPQINVAEGEYSPTYGFQNALLLYASQLQSWLFRGRDLAQPTNNVLTISTVGIVTTQLGVTYAPLDMVRISKSRDSGSNLRGGLFQIASVGPGPNVFTLLNWPYGSTTGGSVRKNAIVYPMVDSANFTVGRVITRRVGRPFVAFRGRRSRKR